MWRTSIRCGPDWKGFDIGALERITREQLDEMEELILLSQFHEKKGHFTQLMELDSRFHEILFEASQSKMLEQHLKKLHQYVQRVRQFSLERGHRAEKSTEEHERIMQAIREKDQERADELATQHILNAIDNIRSRRMEEIMEEK